jgi:hypothetical protein
MKGSHALKICKVQEKLVGVWIGEERFGVWW